MSEEGFGIRERIHYQRSCLASEKGRSTRESAALAPEKGLGLREKVFNVIKKGSVSVRDQRKDCLDVRKGLVSEKGFSFSLVSEKGFSISPIALRKDAQATGWRWKKRGRLGELLAAEGSRAESRTDYSNLSMEEFWNHERPAEIMMAAEGSQGEVHDLT